MMMVPSSIRSSTQDVLPPYLAVFGPGVGIEPLVPQKRTSIQQDGGSGAKSSQGNCWIKCLGIQSFGVSYTDLSPRFDRRPWGTFTVLDEAPTYKVKRLEVLPGKRLSYQKHAKRSEHWMAVSGSARVTLDGREIILSEGETVDVPAGVAHRIENVGETLLVFIEIQTGTYFGEDDIVRLQDDFGR
jgi:mannose-6-phosphate isomerase